MKRIRNLLLSLALLAPLPMMAQQIVAPAGLERSPSPPGARVYFRELEDGDTVSKSFRIKFGIEGMKVRPAGTIEENTGHHHLLIDVAELPPLDLPLPKTEGIYHFGKGEKSASITLPPGTHTLQLVFADHLHQPHDPPVMSEKITVVVSEDAE